MQTMAKLGVLLILVATACGNDSDDARVPRAPGTAPDKPDKPDKPEATAPAAWEIELPFPLIPFDDPAREITIDADDLAPMPVIDAKDVAMPAYTVGKVGRPRELLRAKHLRLSDDSPIATNRGLVEVTDGVGFEARTLEAVLVDFQTGEVERFADAFGTQPGLAIAWGKEKLPDGTERSVLIHPDGQTVPWIAKGTFRELTDVVVNVGRHEILLVQQNQAWRENGRGTTFARWTDLRRPPPPPTLSMPLPPQDDEPTSSPLGAYEFDALGAVRNVVARNTKLHAGCTRVEILPDNTTRCIPAADIILGDGWHLTPGEGEWIAYNEARKEIQHLRFGCAPFEYDNMPRSVDPPRVDFRCRQPSAMVVWSPERTVMLRNDDEGWNNPLARSNYGTLAWWKTPVGPADSSGSRRYAAIADFAALRQVELGCVIVESYSEQARHVLLHRCASPDLLMYDADTAELIPVARGKGCASLVHWQAAGTLWAYTCETASNEVLWTEVIDIVRKRKWRLAGFPTGARGGFRYIWMQEDPAMVVAVDERGGTDRVLAWDLD